MTIFQSVATFTKVEPRGIRFCDNPNKYVCEFLICKCYLCWLQIRAFESITTSCKYEGHSKSSEPQYIGQKIFIVYISVKGTYLAYSCQQIA